MKKLFLRYIKNNDLLFNIINNDKNKIDFIFNDFEKIFNDLSEQGNELYIGFEEIICEKKIKTTRKDLFENFLKENNIDGVFYQELQEQKRQTVNILNKIPLNHIFTDTFSWVLSKQGCRFWARINTKWMVYYYDNFVY